MTLKKVSILERVVSADQAALERTSREHEPQVWAYGQIQLGGALCTLGKHTSGAKSLELAVCAYQAALEVRTRESEPLYWASTKDHLGTALLMLGERTPGIKRLKQAVSAFQEALEELSRYDPTISPTQSTASQIEESDGSAEATAKPKRKRVGRQRKSPKSRK